MYSISFALLKDGIWKWQCCFFFFPKSNREMIQTSAGDDEVAGAHKCFA